MMTHYSRMKIIQSCVILLGVFTKKIQTKYMSEKVLLVRVNINLIIRIRITLILVIKHIIVLIIRIRITFTLTIKHIKVSKLDDIISKNEYFTNKPFSYLLLHVKV